MTRHKTDLLVLAGGAATRLGPLCAGVPKPLLPVGGVPFLVYPLDQVARSINLGRVLISVKKGTSNAFMQLRSIFQYNIQIVEETDALGTGGAILSVLAQATLSDPFLVMNGDVIFRMDAQDLVDQAAKTGAAITAIDVPDAGRFGALIIENNIVTRFQEKNAAHQSGLISAGLYAFTHESLKGFENRPCSFERDIAPVLAKSGALSAVTATGPFMDIGTPESYKNADAFVRAASQL